MAPRCPLGKILATPGAMDALRASGESPHKFIKRHGNGDWGLIDQEDARSNDSALLSGDRILSAYRTATGVKLWIITEADRSATTLLLPKEY